MAHAWKHQREKPKSGTLKVFARLFRTFARQYWPILLVGVVSALLVGGASVDKASIGNVFLGVILFHLMFIVAPRAGAAITGDSMIGEYFRVFVSYAVITIALVMYETNKRKAKSLEGAKLQREQEEEERKEGSR